MAWGQWGSWNGAATARPPWQQARKPRSKREPSWKTVSQLSRQIDEFMATAKGNAKERSEGAIDDSRLAQLKQMRAAATYPPDQKYLDAQITDLQAKRALKLPIHDRLRLAKERKETADTKVERKREHVKKASPALARNALVQATAAVAATGAVYAKLAALRAGTLQPSVDDAHQHLGRLVRPGFVFNTGIQQLPEIERYVRAILARLDGLAGTVERDRRRMVEVVAIEARY